MIAWGIKDYKSTGNKPYLDPWKFNKFFTFAFSCTNPVKWPQILPIVAFGSNVLNCPLNGMNMEESSWIGEDLGAIRPTVCCPYITFLIPWVNLEGKRSRPFNFTQERFISLLQAFQSYQQFRKPKPNYNIYIYRIHPQVPMKLPQDQGPAADTMVLGSAPCWYA